MNNILKKRKLILGLVIVVGVIILTPNGFFTGHRTVTLKSEVTTSKPIIHKKADLTLSSAVISGKVISKSALPISGAMVTAFSEDNNRRTTVYTNENGQYQLLVKYVGELTLRVRTPYFKDSTQKINVVDKRNMTIDISTEKLIIPEDLSSSLTASAHVAQINWPQEQDKATFISQCNFCHQIGNSLTRRPRNKAQWQAVVDRMEGYLVFVTDDEKESIATRLHETFTGAPIKAIQTWDVSPKLANARIEEWNAGDGLSFIHDADVGSDGRLYGADEGHDIIWEIDLTTGEVLEVNLPDVDLPVGGKFSGLALPIGVFSGKHGPHSMAETQDGKMWITNSLSSRLMAYDPKTNVFETYDIGADSMYLHTIRRDKKGRVWFTSAASNQVGRFDPETKQLDLLDLPSNSFAAWLADAFLPTMNIVGAWFPRKNLPILFSHHKWANLGREVLEMPYGIDVNPIDGSIWYVKLYANKIGRIDPETFEIKEIDTPIAGPRRPRFDANGIMWIPAFDIGAILRFDPKTEKFTSYYLPTLAPNEYETPYAINVHPETGEIWITSNMSDRIFSFNPVNEVFTSYPLPTRVSYLRDLVFTKDGKVCSSLSNLPSYAIEGGFGGFICLDPNAIKNNEANTH